jgi:nitrite reductase/ring-hydroxylating ferredoxin subunit
MVLARGIVGDHAGVPKVACPLHKKTFSLEDGRCLSGDALAIATFPVKVEGDEVLVELPPSDSLRPALCPSHGLTVADAAE